MSIYRIVISFFWPGGVQYMAERGVLAMTPGQALDDVLVNLGIDQRRISSLKIWVELPEKLETFCYDAQLMNCVNTNSNLKDLWQQRSL